jgi:hypothetical protein
MGCLITTTGEEPFPSQTPFAKWVALIEGGWGAGPFVLLDGDDSNPDDDDDDTVAAAAAAAAKDDVHAVVRDGDETTVVLGESSEMEEVDSLQPTGSSGITKLSEAVAFTPPPTPC